MSWSPTPFVMNLDRPMCLCGRRMRLASVEPVINEPHAEVRIFDCSHCRHELRIMHSLQDERGPQAA